MNTISLAFLSVGGWQVVLILVVVLILFGGRKMPELAKGLGQSIKEFKKATREASDEIGRAIEDEHHHQSTQAQRPPTPAQPVASAPAAAGAVQTAQSSPAPTAAPKA